MNDLGSMPMSKTITIFAVIATLSMGGAALADSTGKSAPADAKSDKDRGPTGNGGMAGTPPATETPTVEGKSGSQSGPKIDDKMAPKDKY
jgi:hypothetical protein